MSEQSVTSDDLSRAGSRVVDSIVCSSCSEEDSSIMESKYSKSVETPSHANSVIDSCSCVLTRYVRLHEEQLQKLTGEKNFPRTCSGEWLQWEMEDGNRTRIWDPGGS